MTHTLEIGSVGGGGWIEEGDQYQDFMEWLKDAQSRIGPITEIHMHKNTAREIMPRLKCWLPYLEWKRIYRGGR